MRQFTALSLLVLVASVLSAQPQWSALPNAPVRQNSRLDDIYFVNPDLGWATYITSTTATVYKTTDGGATWTGYDLTNPPGQGRPHLRSIRFTDANNGWLGTLAPNAPLWRTTDGGVTWNTVTNLPITPGGICGMFAVGTTHVYGCGVYDPNQTPYFIKSTDGGQNWTVRDMSDVAGSLVDLYFATTDVGFVVGSAPEGGTDLANKKAIVLRTTDGGATWAPVYVTSSTGQLGWKILFPTETTGYVALEPLTPGQTLNPFYLKTTDSGTTWNIFALPENSVNLQGMQFLSDGQRGWAGGWGGNTYETTDGGASWNISFGKNLNRFRVFGDTLGYAVGATIYKFSTESITSVEPHPQVPRFISLDQNYPNPFNPSTTIEFILRQDIHVTLKVFDAQGKEIATLLNEDLNQGIYHKYWDATGFPSGTYFYRLITPIYTETRKMVLVK